MTRPGSGAAPPASPPARFPLWGLAEVSTGARWLDSFGDAIGDEVRRVDDVYLAAAGSGGGPRPGTPTNCGCYPATLSDLW